MRRLIPIHAHLTLVLILTAALPSVGLAQTPVPAAERTLFELTNHIRADHHLPLLSWDPALAVAARQHALRLAQDPFSLEHQYRGEPDLVTRAQHAGAHFSTISENLARGNRSPEDLEALWMTTPIHRANLLGPQLNAVGIGVMESNGLLYAVQDFTHASPVFSRDALEAHLVDLLLAHGLPSAAPSAIARTVCQQHATTSPGASLVVGWDGDATQLPAILLDHLARAPFRGAAVGVCPSDRPADGFANAHVAVLLF